VVIDRLPNLALRPAATSQKFGSAVGAIPATGRDFAPMFQPGKQPR